MLKAERGLDQLSDEQRTDWLRLIRTENVGPVTFHKLLNKFGTIASALDALPELSRRGGRSAALVPISRTAAEDEIAAARELGGDVIAWCEPAYPDLLRHIPAAPPVITIRGGENFDWQRTVGIVGARNASAAGQRLTRLLAEELGDNRYIVVSGLARGIDSAAHQASLSSGTVAVLAGGLDRIYPDENISLAGEILEHGGALITEMPMGWTPRARDFPRRNRLISGLSLGVVVIEAAKRSGSLITARLALEQNREVFAVPGSPLDPRSEGANTLLRQGANLVTCAADIIEVLSMASPPGQDLFMQDNGIGAVFDPPAAQEQEPTPDEQQRLLDALSMTPTPVDEIVQQTGIPAHKVQALLMELDLAGRLEWASGHLVSLKG